MAQASERLLPSDFAFSMQAPTELSPQDHNALEDVFARAYTDKWLGNGSYRVNTLPTIDRFALIHRGDDLAACVGMSVRRVGILAVDPEFNGYGLTSALFQGIAKEVHRPWVSIAIGAEGMLAAATARDVGRLLPVNEPVEIARLFEESSKRGREHGFMFQKAAHKFLADRLKRKGEPQEVFTVVGKTNALHPVSYEQVILQMR